MNTKFATFAAVATIVGFAVLVNSAKAQTASVSGSTSSYSSITGVNGSAFGSSYSFSTSGGAVTYTNVGGTGSFTSTAGAIATTPISTAYSSSGLTVVNTVPTNVIQTAGGTGNYTATSSVQGFPTVVRSSYLSFR